jgi:hypothetical protein
LICKKNKKEIFRMASIDRTTCKCGSAVDRTAYFNRAKITDLGHLPSQVTTVYICVEEKGMVFENTEILEDIIVAEPNWVRNFWWEENLEGYEVREIIIPENWDATEAELTIIGDKREETKYMVKIGVEIGEEELRDMELEEEERELELAEEDLDDPSFYTWNFGTAYPFIPDHPDFWCTICKGRGHITQFGRGGEETPRYLVFPVRGKGALRPGGQ